MSGEMEEFKIEVLELLERAEKSLLEFDHLPENQSSRLLYDEVFRSFHNIKGGAGMMEWSELQQHVHQLENVLMKFKETASIPKRLIGHFLRGIDATREILSGNKIEFQYDPDLMTNSNQTIKSKEIEEFPDEFYSEVNEALDRVSNNLLILESGQGGRDLVSALYRDIHSVKGAVQLFSLSVASELSHAMENVLEGARGERGQGVDHALVSTLLMCVDLMGASIRKPNDPEVKKEIQFMLGLLAPFTNQSVQNTNKEFSTNREEKPVHTPPQSQIINQLTSLASTVSTQQHQPKAQEPDRPDTTIRVQVSLLDRLMTLMGEMVLVRNQVLQYSNKTEDLEFLNLGQKLDVVTSELQEEMMKTRMQPIGNVLNKFQRVVRDLSGGLNKKIQLNLFGTETELDKTLIEAVKDPLTHIVRNACDHGIELPEERKKTGKNEMGTITIKAYHESGQVIVDITDDGKGLSREKILKKAIEKGVLDSARGDQLSDREVYHLIFSPGLSTAEKVTNVSGRGVGMDVVKSNIEKIGGLVEVSSVEGEGTKITLKIPLTLAIVPAMIVRSDEDRYVIPQIKLVELVRTEKEKIEYVQGRPVFRLRGNILALVDLKEVLSRKKTLEEEEAINIVVLNSESHIFGLIVDEIMDTADIVVKPLARFLRPISIYSGATVLGDGSVAFILDVQGVAQKCLGTTTLEKKTVSDKYADSVNSHIEMREFVLVGLGSKTKHAIPLSNVGRMEEVRTSSIERSGNHRVIRYRGGILKLIRLNEIFHYPDFEVEKEITQVIVIKSQDQTFGLEVDQIIDVLSTRDHLDESLKGHEAIMGNLVTSDEVIVVVDVDKICELSTPSRQDFSEVKIPGNLKNMGRILLVEDTEQIRTKLAQGLREGGHEVEVACDGFEGLKKIVEHKFNFDLIISDIEMPRMNGIEFARKIRSISQLKQIPLIAFTAKSSPADIQEAKAAGFTTYVEKSKGKLLPLLISECLQEGKRVSA